MTTSTGLARSSEPLEQARHLAQVELEVAVREADQLAARVLEPGPQRARRSRGSPGGRPARADRRPPAPRRARGVRSVEPSSTTSTSIEPSTSGPTSVERAAHRLLDVLLLVEGGEEEREARALGIGHGRSPSIEQQIGVARIGARQRSWSAIALVMLSYSQLGGDHVDRPPAEEGADGVGHRTVPIVEDVSLVDDRDVRPLAEHPAVVPQRRAVAPPADHHRVGRKLLMDRCDPAIRLAVLAPVERRVAGHERCARQEGAEHDHRRRRPGCEPAPAARRAVERS